MFSSEKLLAELRSSVMTKPSSAAVLDVTTGRPVWDSISFLALPATFPSLGGVSFSW